MTETQKISKIDTREIASSLTAANVMDEVTHVEVIHSGRAQKIQVHIG